jgi:hypothetical protein
MSRDPSVSKFSKFNNGWTTSLGSVLVVFSVVFVFWWASQRRDPFLVRGKGIATLKAGGREGSQRQPFGVDSLSGASGRLEDLTRTSQSAPIPHQPISPQVDATKAGSELIRGLGNDELGRELRVLLSSYLGRSDSLSWRVKMEATPLLAKWRQDPHRGVRDLKETFRRLPARLHPEFRAELLDFTSSLSGQDSQVRDLLWEEFRNGLVSIGDMGKRELTQRSFRGLMGRVGDSEMAMSYAVSAIKLTNDPKLRELVAAEFTLKFPDFEGNLGRKLAGVGIRIEGLEGNR